MAIAIFLKKTGNSRHSLGRILIDPVTVNDLP